MKGGFHGRLKVLIDNFILSGFKILRNFPRDERYETTSQARRALLSIMLNYLEGFGRSKKKVMLNFYEISFTSLKEAIYIFYLGYKLNYISQKDYLKLFEQKEEIAKMLWKTIDGIKKEIKKNDK